MSLKYQKKLKTQLLDFSAFGSNFELLMRTGLTIVQRILLLLICIFTFRKLDSTKI